MEAHCTTACLHCVTLSGSHVQGVPEVGCNREQTVAIAVRIGPSSTNSLA